MQKKGKMALSRIFALVLALTMAMLCLSGCDKKDSGKSGGGSSSGGASNVAAVVNEQLETLKSFDFDKMNVDAELTVSVTDDFKSLLKQLGVEEEYTDLFGIKKAGLKINAGRDGDLLKGVIGASLNGTDIIDANAIVDVRGGYVYVSVPDLNSKSIRVDASELKKVAEMFDALSGYTDAISEIDVDKIAKLLEEYINEALACIDDVESGSETITANGVSQKVDATTYHVGQKDVMEMGVAVLNKLKDDSDVKDLFMDIYPMIQKIAEMSGESLPDASEIYNDEFMKMIDEAVSELEEELSEAGDGGETVDVTVYTASGEFKGIKVYAEGMEAAKLCMAESGSDVGVELNVMNQFAATIGGTVKSGKFTGECVVAFEGQEIKFGLEDIDVNKLDSGTIVLPGSTIAEMAGNSMASAILNECEFKLKIASKGEMSGDISLMLYYGGKLMADATLSVTVSDNASSISVPSSFIDSNDSSSMQSWVESIDPNTIINRLSKAGLSKELISQMKSSLAR